MSGARSFFGKTERRLALVILLTSVIPLVVTWALANSLFKQASSLWFNREVGVELDRGVGLAKDYVAATKVSLRNLGLAVSREPALVLAQREGDAAGLAASMQAALDAHPELFSVELWSGDGHLVAHRERGAEVDETVARSLHVEHPLTRKDGTEESLKLTFTVSRLRLDELESAGAIVQRYHRLESSRDELYGGYLRAFAILLLSTALATTILGVVLARGVTKRIGRLGAALRLVAAGDLSVSVPVTGSDELTELATSFNQMIAQVAESRARVEFLQRMGAWQEMAKRLAHEIKNPLTPIQLAVEECQRRYDGSDPRFTGLLDTTVEIVREEVGSLRHLVEHFANFARLPAPMLEATELVRFVRDVASERSIGSDAEHAVRDWPEIELVLPETPVHVTVDRQLFRRVLVNLLDNAAEARAQGHAGTVRLAVRALDGSAELVVEDDGPGIPEEMHEEAFRPFSRLDPSRNQNRKGVGLGLAIARDVARAHGGDITLARSDLGGLKALIRLPG